MTTVSGRPLRTVLVEAERRLASNGVPSPRADAELLLAHVLGVPRSRLILSDDVDRAALVRYEALVAKRSSRQPLQHLVGSAPFRSRQVLVGRGVFIPRPETEIVAEAAIRELLASPTHLAVDLCAGSGALGLALATEVPGTTVHLVESDAGAVEWLRRNADAAAEELATVGSVAFVHHDDATTTHRAALAALAGSVDVLTCNPPYIPDRAEPREVEVREFDPPTALYGGVDGLEVVRAVVVAAAALLRPGGVFVVEHGDTQGEGAGETGVPRVLRASTAFGAVVDRVDLAGRDRYCVARRL